MQQLVRSYTMVVDRETSQGVGSMLSLVLTTRWSLRVAAFFLDNHLVLLSVLLLSIGAAAWVVVVFIGATVASNLFLALVGVELRTYQSSATLGYHTTTHSARSIDTVFILVVGTWVTTLSKVCTGVVHHRLLAIVCGKLIFVRHKLVVSPTIARRASVRHRTAICRDSSIYLHGPRLWVALGVAATFIRFFMEGSTECVFVVRPFLFQKRFCLNRLISCNIITIVFIVSLELCLLRLEALIKLFNDSPAFLSITASGISTAHSCWRYAKTASSTVSHVHFVGPAVYTSWVIEEATTYGIFWAIVCTGRLIIFGIL